MSHSWTPRLCNPILGHPSKNSLFALRSRTMGRKVAIALCERDRSDTEDLIAYALTKFLDKGDSIFLLHAMTSPSPAWVTGGEPRAVEYINDTGGLPAWVPDALKTLPCKVTAYGLDATSFTPVDALIDFVQEVAVDVLLVGSRARSRVFFSSSSYIAEYCDVVPVLVVKATKETVSSLHLGDSPAARQIAILMDGTNACGSLTDFAARTVLRPADHVFLMHSPAGQEPSATLTAMGNVEAARVSLLGKGFTHVFPMELVGKSDVRDAIVDQLQAGEPPFDLCICGSRGIRGTAKRIFLGSVSRYVLAHSPCPVMIVPPGVLAQVEPKTEQ